jgi:hypothetical protein
MSNDAGALAD